MQVPPPSARELLSLTLTSGVGPILAARLLGAFRSIEAIAGASPQELERVRGIGRMRSQEIARGMRERSTRVEEELRRAEELGVRLIGLFDEAYPALLRAIPDPPTVLYAAGELDAPGADRYPVAIVGSRACTAYGIEQAERFAGVLARSGLTVVSGGARGIDTAAHRGAARAGGRTIVVLGCGLAHRYPEENAELFARFVEEGRGVILSELPLDVAPDAKNFPARNRLISGLSLGVVVIEAAKGSGALITAKLAAEDHAREVLGVPGRVDSTASEGTLELLRIGGAAIATSPTDVIEWLERAGWHLHRGTFEARYGAHAGEGSLFDGGLATTKPDETPPTRGAAGAKVVERAEHAAVLEALGDGAHTLDQLVTATGLDPGRVRSVLTILEIEGRVRRSGGRVERTRPS